MAMIEQIQEKLQLREGVEVEYKSAKGGFPQAFWESFSAFANTDGGIIVLGVREKNGKFIPDGLTEEQITAYRKKFWDDAHNKSRVSIPLLVESDVDELITERGSCLLIFHVPRAPYNLRPVYLTLTPFGHTYKRRHEGDYVCSDDEIREMFSDANNLKSSADSRILRGYSMDDIDLPTLHRFRRAYYNKHENHPWNEDDDMRFLEHIGAYRKDRVTSVEGFTVAGLLMFGKTNSITDPECCPYFFLDYRERLSDDPNIRWTNRIYPDGNWEANLYQFFTRVLPLMQQALPVPFRLDDNLQRIESTSAHTSLREALANCLIHCAYNVIGNITIDRYFDKIVLSNPGTMLISLEEFREGGRSVCRNPILQKMFVFLGIGEKAGSGADIISKGWSDNGWNKPIIRECSNPNRVELVLEMPIHANIVVDRPTINEGQVSGSDEKPTINKGQVGASDDKPTINKGQVGTSDDKPTINIDVKTSILLFLNEHPNSKTAEIAEFVHLQSTQTKHYLYQLLAEGRIVQKGANKNRTYSIQDKVDKED